MRAKVAGGVLMAILGAIAGCTSSSGPSGDCGTLTACCSQLSGDNASVCAGVVNQHNTEACSEAQSEFEGENLCGGGGASTGGSDCSDLSSCCKSLSSTEKTGCDAIVKVGTASACSQQLAAYKAGGFCGKSGGGGTEAGTGGGSGCSGLSSCCASLPSAEQADCNTIVSAGEDSVCSEEVTALQASGLCGGGGGNADAGGGGSGCSGPSSCCASLPSAEQADCNTIVSAGEDSVCSEEVTALQASGLCGGGSNADAGGGGGGCSSLSSCCGSLPSAEQADCNTIATSGDDAICSSTLTTLQEGEYCN